MATPWLSVVVPTIGRSTLPDLLDSMDKQADPSGVQVLLVADTHGGQTHDLRVMRMESYVRGPRYRWIEHDAGRHAWGHPQRMEGMRQAVAPWIAFSQDDNILTEGAFSAIWEGIQTSHEPKPLLFKVRTWQAGIVWKEPRIRHSNVDADCIVVPNDPERLGTWADEYAGDFHFIEQTAKKWGGNVRFLDAVIALGHPTSQELWARD